MTNKPLVYQWFIYYLLHVLEPRESWAPNILGIRCTFCGVIDSVGGGNSVGPQYLCRCVLCMCSNVYVNWDISEW